MSAALGLLLIAQLNSFEFTDIESPQIAGDTFRITIVAKDPYGGIYPYNGSALLSTTRDGFWTFVRPNLIPFVNGIYQDTVIVTLAESLRLRCVEPQNLITGESNEFAVFSGPPTRFFTIMPGEEMAPGSPDGRLPSPPQNQIAGESFTVDVHLTDAWYNVVEARNDSVYVTSTDSFGTTPAGQLSNGSGAFDVGMRQAGNHRLYAHPGGGSPISADTSSAFTVIPGGYERILVLLPGETSLPGDNATQPWQTPGKAGEPTDQFLRTPFVISAYACDNCWNQVSAVSDSVELESYFPFSAVPQRAELGDGADFMVEFNDAGPNQNVWATTTGGLESYLNWFDVRPLGTVLEITAPDTVRAGETAYVHVTMKDANDEPVVAAPCRFAVVAGNGDMLDSALLTDTLGRVTARFLCTRAYGDEHDTIKISADTTVYIRIFVEMPDSSLLGGGIVVFPNPFGFNRDRAEITYFLRSASAIDVTIYDTFGNEVVSWHFRTGQEGALSGVNRIYWDGRNSRNRRVANGIYVVQVLGMEHTGTTFKSTQRIGVIW